ncbi:restriction endonuclease subunit S [Rhizobium leguminosarum bv. viciae]|nr:restriction endonuclease subunit S [Rhizobium leguminosarum bv. viciae]TCB53313.1 restriction endonuclease subunit S [Rhizobium leguminosarum bv. viciae]
MSHSLYPAYTRTDVPWLGDIPIHWKSQRLKLLFEIVKQIANTDSLDVLSVTQKGIKIKDIESNEGQLSMDYSKYQIVHPGDFVMNHMDLLTGYVDESRYHGVTSPDYRAFRLRDQRYCRRFFLYLLQNCYHQRLFFPFGQGSSHLGRWRLPTEAFNEFTFPVPPPEEQTAIASFLDRETTKIDALVEEQKRLIELLRDKRQAVISHAVTKGLNPDARMKDSGIAWLGEMPDHWNITALKHLGSIRYGIGEPPTYREAGTPLIRATNVHEGRIYDEGVVFVDPDDIPNSKIVWLTEGDIIVVRSGAYTGDSAIVPPDFGPAIAGFDMVFRPAAANPEFLQFTLLSTYVKAAQTDLMRVRAAQPHLNAEELGSCTILLPPPSEQETIAKHLQSVTLGIDKLVGEATAGITLLIERRAALISAAVTGKIDVRESLTMEINRSQIRLAVGSEVVERLSHRPTFGRVKLQKIVYLAETYAGVDELEGHYQRGAAGPLDRDLIADIENLLQRSGNIVVEQPDGRGGLVHYKVIGSRGTQREELDGILGKRKAKFEYMIAKVGDLDTKGAEAVATLFAVWNDALIDNQPIINDRIVSGVLAEWHPEKPLKFKRDELHTWLGWMRRNDIVPTGSGPRTITGRLLF